MQSMNMTYACLHLGLADDAASHKLKTSSCSSMIVPHCFCSLCGVFLLNHCATHCANNVPLMYMCML